MSEDLHNEKQFVLAVLLIMLATFLVIGGGWIVASYMKAVAYTRITGKEVTTWDAMWVDLRIQEPVKP